MKKFTLLTAMLIFTSVSFAQVKLKKDAQKALESINSDAIRSHIAYLADDKLKGRLPGTPEYQVAMDYVIDKFKEYGLEPAGENGTFLQKVKIRTATIKPDGAAMIIKGIHGDVALTDIEECVILPDLNHRSARIEAPVVFAGYGLDVPELDLHDYEGLDIKGKIVIVRQGVPDGLPSEEGAHLRYRKDEIALAKGAVGLIEVYEPGFGDFQWRARYYRQSGKTGVILDGGQGVSLRNGVSATNFVQGIASWKGLEKMIKTMGVDSETWAKAQIQEDYSKVEFKGKLALGFDSSFKDWESYNVVAKLEGSHRKLKKEYIVHSAHLDHVGVGRSIKGDSIYNGAHDNASGVAMTLEIARAMSSLKKKPKRSILFVMVTAEEKGLLGSFYFASQPTVPKQQIVANINLDMPAIVAPMQAVIAFGAGHSSLNVPTQKASKHLGLEMVPDPQPDQVIFIRSDQYSFVLQGIPAIYLDNGRKLPASKAEHDDFIKNHYHQPSDELIEERFDWPSCQKFTQLNFLVSLQVGKEKEAPKWRAGSIFAK